MAGVGRGARCDESVELLQNNILGGHAALQRYFWKGSHLVHIRIVRSIGGERLLGGNRAVNE
jgi:hypothetical protein